MCRLCDHSIFSALWSSLAGWFTGCIGFPRSFFLATGLPVTSSSWRLQVSDSERSTSPDSCFVATGFSVAVSTNSPRYASCTALENSTLRRILDFFSSCFQFSPQLWCNRTFCGWGTCQNMCKTNSLLQISILPQLISSSFCSCILFAIVLVQLYQAGILGAASKAEMARCWTNEEDFSIRHVWNYLWSKCLRLDVW